MTNTLREAIRVLSRVGWATQTFTDKTGRHCLQGALFEAHGVHVAGQEGFGKAVRGELAADLALVNEVIREQFPERFGAVGASRFNDHPDTTVEDVILVMDKAAVRKDEQA